MLVERKKYKSIISIDISGEETAAIHSNGSLKLHLDVVKSNFFLLLMAVTKATIRLWSEGPWGKNSVWADAKKLCQCWQWRCCQTKNAFTQLFVEGCGIWSLQQLGYLSKLLNCLWEARAWGTAAVDIGFFMRSKIYPLFVM